MKSFLLSFFLCFIGSFYPLITNAQYKLSAAVDGLAGFNTSEVYLQSNKLDQSLFIGFGAYAINEYQIESHSLRSIIGFKGLWSDGTYEGENFDVKSYKLVLGLGYGFKLTDNFKIGAGIELENNLDFNEIRGQTAEILRTSFISQIDYKIHERIDIYLLYYRALSPIFDTYLIFNPENQFRLGLSYRIL